MRITADHAFHIGSQHLRIGKPCQDYALSGYGSDSTGEDAHFAIVSDGCSSGGQTDVGARITAHSTATALRRTAPFGDGEVVDAVAQHIGFTARTALHLDQEDMLATCAYVLISDRDDPLVVRIIGDGVLATRDTAGNLEMTRIDWADNMPVYPAYYVDSYRSFIEAHGGDADLSRVTKTTFCAIGGHSSQMVESLRLSACLRGVQVEFDPAYTVDAAVFSDGVTQVDGVDWRDVVTDLMSFKSTAGDFVKRRMNRFLKECQRHGKGPIDDISMACIHFEHEN